MTKDDNTIGLTELLDEVSRDLDDFRKKHQSDYSVKNITLWWELERDRVVTRHAPNSVVKTLRRARGAKWMLAWFVAGWLTTLSAQSAIRMIELVMRESAQTFDLSGLSHNPLVRAIQKIFPDDKTVAGLKLYPKG